MTTGVTVGARGSYPWFTEQRLSVPTSPFSLKRVRVWDRSPTWLSEGTNLSARGQGIFKPSESIWFYRGSSNIPIEVIAHGSNHRRVTAIIPSTE